MTPLRRRLAENLKVLRNGHRWSQATLAEKAGLSPSYVGDLEVAAKWPSAEQLSNLAEALLCEPWQLLMDPSDRVEYQKYLENYALLDRFADQVSNSIRDKVETYLANRDK